MEGKFIGLLLTAFLLLTGTACDTAGQRKRPYGYLRVGKIADFKAGANYLPNLRLLVRSDQNGFAIMSTLCTYDLSALKQVSVENSYTWKSDYSTSTYAADGKVLTGPATQALPYYKLVVDQWDIKSPRDTLYVHIGEEQPRDWRLKITEVAPQPTTE